MLTHTMKAVARKVNSMLKACEYNTEAFKQSLETIGAKSIGGGAYKSAFLYRGVVVKFSDGYATLNQDGSLKVASQAVREWSHAPDSLKPFMAFTTRVHGVIIQEKAYRVGGRSVRGIRYDQHGRRNRDMEVYQEMGTMARVAGTGFEDLGLTNMGFRKDGRPIIFDGWPEWSGSPRSPIRCPKALRLDQP